GETIQAIPLNRDEYEIGRVVKCHKDETYDVKFDSGKVEKYVPEESLREVVRSKHHQSPRHHHSPHKSSRDDLYDHGDKHRDRHDHHHKEHNRQSSSPRPKHYHQKESSDETNPKAKSPRKPTRPEPITTTDSESSHPPKFRVGQSVKGDYKRQGEKIAAIVAKVHSNGTYDLEYETGKLESHVPESAISTSVHNSPKKKVVSEETTTTSDEKVTFEKGQKVEAKYGGKSTWKSGVISRKRVNGTYDIDYDGGEKETGVAAKLIRPKPKSPAKKKVEETSTEEEKPKKNKFKQGDKIEARYKGRETYYSGVIARVRLNGSYDIDYDDGEKETGISVDLIRSRGSSSPKKKPAEVSSTEEEKPKKHKFQQGDKIEAKCGGEDKYYPGVVSRVKLNGTYIIEFDHGITEAGIPASSMRERASSPKKKSTETSSEDDRKPSKKFKEGEKVEAQYKGKSKFYPGVIARCRMNGTYDIDYEDGEKEKEVAANMIRSKEKSSPKKKIDETSTEEEKPKKNKFQQGDKIEARCGGEDKYYPGVITRVRLNGTYIIEYDHGITETGVAADLIRPRSSSPKKKHNDDTSQDENTKCKKFKEGEKVEAQYKGKSKFYPGVISRCRLNGTYDIDYDDGEKEKEVAAELIRSREKSSPSKKSKDDSEDDKKAKKFKEGEKVEAQHKGKSKFYPGVISRCRLNGTYDIDYDDGEKETGVAADLIRSKEKSSPRKKSSDTSEDEVKAKKFKEGEKVEAQYKGKSKFYPGVIGRCRLNGTYDIDYDDGEKETGVAADLIRSREKTSPKKSKSDDSTEDEKQSKKLKEGDKIEAQYKGKSKFYPGVISRCRLNGTYDIDYDDGEKETGVSADLIRLKEKSSPKKKSEDSTSDEKKSQKFKEGEKVEAQYKGKSRFYPGVISRCRLNGTYDIDYDDGEKETGVAAELIRSKEKSSPKKGKNDSRSDDDEKIKFKEGEKIECLYKGKSKYYPGVIARVRSNGTYDIDYDDGEKEKEVEAKLIRSREKSSPKKKSSDVSEDDNKKSKKFKEGEKVEAQYKGKSKFYPGVISRCRLNGTYDIDYDDGEKEKEVAAELIRSREKSSPSKKSKDDSEDDKKAKKFKEGEKVEAQHKGKSKFYPGVISRCRLNGTYDIDYDDGEKETGVAADLIRSKEKSSPKRKPSDDTSDEENKRFKEGEKIEALYKGKTKYYPGVIARVRSNGTYDVDYDDGEKEKEVVAKYIRSKQSSSPKKKNSDDSDNDKKPSKFKEGDKIEAQYKGKEKFYSGMISRCRLNGTYDIDYDDGEKEKEVEAKFIRLKGSSPRKRDNDNDDDKKSKKFKEGEKVEAQYKGKSKFYPGVISRCRLNGTYDIDYDDGEKETGVAADLIRSKEKSSPAKKSKDETSDEENKRFKEGEKIEALYKGKTKYYPGVIARVRSNGTYDVDYDDGEKEKEVPAKFIRSKQSSSPKKKSSDDSDADKNTKKFKEGEKVEAQYKGKAKFYPGVISRCRLNGTYDIDYDDGEKETGVSGSLIRSKESSSAKMSSDPFGESYRVGTKVEALYKGNALATFSY
ncbi:unnamed protein product, partial [Aphanomyces euteiches]